MEKTPSSSKAAFTLSSRLGASLAIITMIAATPLALAEGTEASETFIGVEGLVVDERLDQHGKVYVQDGGTLEVTSELHLYSGTSSYGSVPRGLLVGNSSVGSVELDGDIVLHLESQVAGFYIGRTSETNVSGTGSVVMKGGSIRTDESAAAPGTYLSFNVGRGTGSVGTFQQQGGVVDVKNGAFQVAVSSGTGTYIMTNDAEVLVDNTFYVGSGAGANGLLEIHDSARFIQGSSSVEGVQVYIGTGGATGKVLQVGVDTEVSVITRNPVRIGHNGGSGTYELESGKLTLGGTQGVRIGDGGGATGIFSQEGGTFTTVGDLIVGGSNATGTYTITGGTATLAAKLILGQSEGGEGTANLNGGTVEIGGTDAIAAGTGTAVLNLGGATIKVVNSDLTTSVSANLVADKTSVIDTNGRNATWSGDLKGDGNLKKDGTGDLTLSGSNSYTGTTEITAGTLLVSTRTGSGNVTIREGATIGGNGAVAGFATIEGTLMPGNSPGTLTFEQGLTLTTSSSTVLEIVGLGSGEFDSIAVTGGNLTLGGALTLNLVNTFEEDVSFNLFGLGLDVDVLGNFDSVTLIGAYGSGSLTQYGDQWLISIGDETIRFNAVSGLLQIPEPSSWALLAGGAAIAVWLRRRRLAAL